MSARTVRHVILRGRVQGVGFRVWTEHMALRHGLEGFVRNRRDGSVEAAFAGAPQDVEAMIAQCRDGPPGAHVEAVDELDADATLLDRRKALRCAAQRDHQDTSNCVFRHSLTLWNRKKLWIRVSPPKL